MSDSMMLIAGGIAYAGWTEIACGRGMDRCVGDFDIAVSERWPDSTRPILPFTPAVLRIGPDVVLTGYVNSYAPRLRKDDHGVRIAGRSNTQDIVDCSLLVPSGQFSGYSLAAIGRAICQSLGTSLVVETLLASTVIPDATRQPCETAFEFYDRLCTVAGVILTDDEYGRLVITTAGATRSTTHLVQGVNIEEVSANVTCDGRFSQYIVVGQAGLPVSLGASGQSTPGQAKVITDQVAIAYDQEVPRYRPKVYSSESATGQDALQMQANWHKSYAVGKSLRAQVTVSGWRQDDGSLWKINQMVAITAPAVGVDQDLLVFAVDFKLTKDDGTHTVLTLAPCSAATPNPKLLRLRKRRRHGRGVSGINWDGAGDEGLLSDAPDAE